MVYNNRFVHRRPVFKIEKDSQMVRLLDRLRTTDISSVESVDFDGERLRGLYPTWYYLRKMARLLRRIIRTEHNIKNVNFIHGKK